jgi:hypothetical protein
VRKRDTTTAAILEAADNVLAVASGARPFKPAPARVWRSLRFPRGYSAADTSEDGRSRSIVVLLRTDLPLRPHRGRGPSVRGPYNSLVTNRLREVGSQPDAELIRRYGWLRELRQPLAEDTNGQVYMVVDLELARELAASRRMTVRVRKEPTPGTKASRRALSDVDAAAAAIREIVRPTAVPRRQGPRLSAEERKAIERRAVELAKRYYRKRRWRVEEVRRRPYDLLCRRGDQELRVEVKGTTGDGREVLVTAGEVKHAESHRRMVSLAVVSGISFNKSTGEASGGSLCVLDPWKTTEGALQPIAYRYRLPPEVCG